MKRRGRTARVLFLEGAILSVLAVAGLLFGLAVDRRLGERMDRLKAQALAALETQLGRRISYESLSPSVFGFLAVRDLTVYSEDAPEEPLVRIHRLKIHYDILRLLSSRDPLHAVSEINIGNSSFSVDAQRDRELLALVDSLMRGGGGPAPQRLFSGLRLSGSNISVTYVQNGRTFDLSKLFFAVASDGSFYQASLRCNLGIRDSGGGLLETVSSRLKANGRIGHELDWSDLSVRIQSLATRDIALERQTFQVAYDGRKLEVRKIQDRSPLHLELKLDLEQQQLRAVFRSENFRPSDMVRLTGALKRFDPYLRNEVTASGEVDYDFRQAALSYELDLRAVVTGGALPGRFELLGRLQGNEKIVYCQPLRLRSDLGGLEFYGNVLFADFFPSGLLHLQDARYFSEQSVNAALQLRRGTGSLTVEGQKVSVGSTQFGPLRLDLKRRDRRLEFTLATTLASAEAGNSLEASGSVSLPPRPRLQVRATLVRIGLGSVYDLLQSPKRQSAEARRMLGGLSVSTTLEVDTDFSAYRVGSDRVEVRSVRNPANRITLRLAGDRQSLALSQVDAAWRGYHLTGQAEVADLRAERGATTFKSSFVLEDIPYRIEGRYLPGREIHVTGSHELSVSYLFSGWGSPALQPDGTMPPQGSPFRIYSRDLPIPLKEGTLLASLNVEGIVTRSGEILALSPESRLRNIPMMAVRENELAAGFSVSDGRISLNTLTYRDRISRLSGSGEAVISGLAPLTASLSLALAQVEGGERYSLTGSLEGEGLTAGLEFQNVPLTRFGENVLAGSLSGDMEVSGSLPEPELQAALSLNDGRLNVDPVELDLQVGYASRELTLSGLRLGFLNHLVSEGGGKLDLDSGDFAFNSRYRGVYFDKPVEGAVHLEGRMDPPHSFKALRGVLKRKVEGTIRLQDLQVEGKSVDDWLIGFDASGGVLSLEGGPGEAIRGRVAESGDFSLELLDPLPVQGTASGRVQAARVQASFDISALDMRVINTVTVGTDVFTFTSGSAAGRLRVEGQINDPDFYGSLRVSGAAMSFALSPDPIAPIQGSLVFNEKSFTMEPTSSFAGRDRVTASGEFAIDHWVPVGVELHFQVDSSPGVRIRYNFGTVFVDGRASGTVHVLGDATMTRVDGDVVLLSGRIAMEKGEKPPENPYAPPLSVKMTVHTGTRVEFYWPSISFPIVHSYASQGEKVQLAYDGDLDTFSMNGSVGVRGGEIFYFDRSFYIKQGSITFSETVGQLDPRIQALAELRERDQNNEEIRIYLEADNRLSQFQPRFYSEPSRSDVEILNLIGGNIFGRFEESGFGLSAVMLTSDLVGQFGILTPFERAVRDILGLDMFSVRTQFVQNVLLGKLLGEGGTLNPLDNTTLSLGKYLGTDLFLEAQLRFQAVDAMSPDYVTSQQIQTEGEINLEWLTPFFQLEWSFIPRHPESLFLTDNSIRLSWKFSY